MNEEHRFLDMLNARKCEVIAKCAGVKNVKAVEFLILKREPEKLKFESPQEMALKLAMMGG